VKDMHTYDSPEGRANVAAIESELARLDGVFMEFCAREGYTFSTFSPIMQLWPRRRVWQRQEIDRCMDLTMEIGVQDVLDHGFNPNLRWSLFASGSLHPSKDSGVHVLSRAVFEHVPFSALASVLASGLERGLKILNSMTEIEILSDGESLGGSTRS
jgi:hypothetical protein